MSREKYSYKRRDKKGRILQNGETQQKDGRYRYTYIDEGVTKCLYSWTLVETDIIPSGKRKDLCLREKIRLMERKRDEQRVQYISSTTVAELVNKYILQKTGVRPTTRAGYKTVKNILANDLFGKKAISDIRVSDAKEWLIKLQQVDKKSYSSIHTIRGVLRTAFQMAVNDDLIVKNPFEFPLVGVIINDYTRCLYACRLG